MTGAIALAAALAGCASTTAPRARYDEIAALAAHPHGFGRVRFAADAPLPYERIVRAAAEASLRRGARPSVLALSGGGEDGAFGAGLLRGLAETGRRPEWSVVTGVSTGALMAPYAFLGSRYDGLLGDLYTDGLAAGLVSEVSLVGALRGDAFVPQDRIGALVARYVDRTLLDEVAREHARGRRLLVLTTDVDSQVSWAWDMGAIASDASPAALDLFREVLAASASVPGLFRPRMIDVDDGQGAFSEMHVDGGVRKQLYVAPDAVVYGSGGRGSDPFADVYVVADERIDPTLRITPDATLSILSRSVSTLLKADALRDVLAARSFATRTGAGFHLAAIGSREADVTLPESREGFSTAHMRRLYAHGLEAGRSARPWAAGPSPAVVPVRLDEPRPVEVAPTHGAATAVRP